MLRSKCSKQYGSLLNGEADSLFVTGLMIGLTVSSVLVFSPFRRLSSELKVRSNNNRE